MTIGENPHTGRGDMFPVIEGAIEVKPATAPFRSALAVEARERMDTICGASATELRNLAATVREKANVIAMGFEDQAADVRREGEQAANEIDAMATRVESTGNTVALSVEEFSNTIAAVGLHTRDLHARLRPPVAHPNGGRRE